MRLRHAILVAGLAIATPLIAQQAAPQLPGAVDTSRVAAGSYKVDPAHTLVGWRVNHFGFTDYFGMFGDVTGTLALDPKNVAAAKLDVTIPVSKVTVASQHLAQHLMTKDFFGPTVTDARFVSTKVTPRSATAADVTGNLTLNGVTKPVTLAVKFTGAGTNPMTKAETVGFEGMATIKRSDFNVSYAIPFVSDEVRLDIVGAFEKAQ